MAQNTLIVITGPTGVGKTDTALRLSKQYNAPILSADSRQIYRGIPIGTAAPTETQLAMAQHYFVACKNLDEYYSAAQYEADVMALLPQLFAISPYAILCGGSMMYVDAVCNGIDEIPTITEAIRAQVMADYETNGLDTLCNELKERDSEYYDKVDLQNHKRVIHAIEICRQTGNTYTSLRTATHKQRPFRIVKIALTLPREMLFERIALRTDIMMERGLLDEVKSVAHISNYNSLNTVGYKELFMYLRGEMTMEQAVEKIKRNTRVYAKKQMTWYKKDSAVKWVDISQPDYLQQIYSLINNPIL